MHVLIVDDDPAMRQMLERGLRPPQWRTSTCGSPAEALTFLHRQEVDVLVTDLRMRGATGIDLCRQVVEVRPDVPVIVITAFGSMESAVDALRAGAFDFVTKPFQLDVFRLALARAARHRELTRRLERLEQALGEHERFDGMLGTSPAMAQAFDLIHRVAPSDSAVLITGESGTGKELAARAIHRRSPRRSGPFVAINCAAMPENLLESELFGHVKGAFTDAASERRGLFVQADQGTLFLDEVGELPLGLQPKLLRALQERTVRPLGGRAEIPFDARVVVATNRDLEAAVGAGAFRQDLFYRIHVIAIEMPPLRERGNDVLTLAQHFLEHFSRRSSKEVLRMQPAVAEKLMAYPWPGNVRELQNCIERAVILCRHNELSLDDLPAKVRGFERREPIDAALSPEELLPMDEVERRHVVKVYAACEENKSEAARLLGFTRKTLYRKLRRYGVITDDEGDAELDD